MLNVLLVLEGSHHDSLSFELQFVQSQQDFVLVRSDGVPLYNFGAVVDDLTMEISIVARGRDHMINTPPQNDMARQKGFPVIIDFYKEGLKIIGPGTAVTREFTQKNPNTVKVFLMGLLDGVKRAIDDEEYASKLESKYSKVTDAKILAENYQQGLRVWNKDMTVDPSAIRVVLENTPDGKGKDVDPKRFYDNSFIQAVNRDYGSKLFPGEIK
jgi:ABC-type nitrate/sulfonate/bicarbonate transport system substrate-binding protein